MSWDQYCPPPTTHPNTTEERVKRGNGQVYKWQGTRNAMTEQTSFQYPALSTFFIGVKILPKEYIMYILSTCNDNLQMHQHWLDYDGMSRWFLARENWKKSNGGLIGEFQMGKFMFVSILPLYMNRTRFRRFKCPALKAWTKVHLWFTAIRRALHHSKLIFFHSILFTHGCLLLEDCYFPRQYQTCPLARSKA